MHYPEDTDTSESTEKDEHQRLLVDGTASLDYSDDDQPPRVKGLIELINQYFANKPK